MRPTKGSTYTFAELTLVELYPHLSTSPSPSPHAHSPRTTHSLEAHLYKTQPRTLQPTPHLWFSPAFHLPLVLIRRAHTTPALLPRLLLYFCMLLGLFSLPPLHAFLLLLKRVLQRGHVHL